MLLRGSSLLGGSWVAINGVILRVTILISHIRGLVTPLITGLQEIKAAASLVCDSVDDITPALPQGP